MDEQERILLVERYHRKAHEHLPSPQLHALIHSTVENQLALPDQAVVKDTLARLMREGLDRHEAVHAIGSVLAGLIFESIKSPSAPAQAIETYYEELAVLTAGKWRAG